MRFQAQNAATPLEPTDPPSRLWQMVATDLFSFDGHTYLVVGDYHSKMHVVRKYPMGQTGSAKTIAFLKELFSEHGIPEILRSNNGLQYSSAEFQAFCKNWKIDHCTSSPLHPKLNGFAEAMVKIIKGAMQKAKHSGSDPYLALLDLRATPIDAQLPSPAELLYQCRLRTTLPCQLKNTDPSAQDIQDHLDQKQDNQKRGKDQHAKALAPLYTG